MDIKTASDAARQKAEFIETLKSSRFPKQKETGTSVK